MSMPAMAGEAGQAESARFPLLRSSPETVSVFAEQSSLFEYDADRKNSCPRRR